MFLDWQASVQHGRFGSNINQKHKAYLLIFPFPCHSASIKSAVNTEQSTNMHISSVIIYLFSLSSIKENTTHINHHALNICDTPVMCTLVKWLDLHFFTAVLMMFHFIHGKLSFKEIGCGQNLSPDQLTAESTLTVTPSKCFCQ